MWSLVIDLKGNEFVWSFNYLNGQFLEDFLENIFVVAWWVQNQTETKPKQNHTQTKSKPKQKHTKPELWIFFCDVIVVGDTKIFKPGPVDAVWGLKSSVRNMFYRYCYFLICPCNTTGKIASQRYIMYKSLYDDKGLVWLTHLDRVHLFVDLYVWTCSHHLVQTEDFIYIVFGSIFLRLMIYNI